MEFETPLAKRSPISFQSDSLKGVARAIVILYFLSLLINSKVSFPFLFYMYTLQRENLICEALRNNGVLVVVVKII